MIVTRKKLHIVRSKEEDREELKQYLRKVSLLREVKLEQGYFFCYQKDVKTKRLRKH